MPDLDDLQFNKPEDEIDYSDMSIDELLESTREELAHDDELMGETPEQKAPEEQPRQKHVSALQAHPAGGVCRPDGR